MRLGFDATSLAARGKGVMRFQAEFLRAAAESRLIDDLTVFVPEQAPEAMLPPVPRWRYVPLRTSPMILCEQVRLPRAARAERIDVLVTTSERAPLWGPPTVIYLYEHPRHRIARQRESGAGRRQRLANMLTGFLFPVALRRATVVLAASAATARDLERIRSALVVPSGVSTEFRAADAAGEGGGYFLHLASDDPRDNTETVLRALARLRAQGHRPRLVIAGPLDQRLAATRQLAEALGVSEQITWLGYQTGRGLIELYGGATAYVDASLYEGFGLQALEALACGTPAIVSNNTSLPEVVGNAGFLVDPLDVDGFADAMARLEGDPELLRTLRRRALERAKTFTWRRTVEETLRACADAYGGTGLRPNQNA